MPCCDRKNYNIFFFLIDNLTLITDTVFYQFLRQVQTLIHINYGTEQSDSETCGAIQVRLSSIKSYSQNNNILQNNELKNI